MDLFNLDYTEFKKLSVNNYVNAPVTFEEFRELNRRFEQSDKKEYCTY